MAAEPQDLNPMDTHQRTEIEAAAFRRLIAHLQSHTDVQNIELMLTADFCRNCLAKWYAAAAQDLGTETDYEAALEAVYGMPYDTWKQLYQREAAPDQQKQFAAVMADPAKHG